MALTSQGEIPFSLLNAIIKSVTGVADTLGTLKDLPLIRRVELSPNVNEILHRGDGRLAYTNVLYESVGLTLEVGQLNLETLAMIQGGTAGMVVTTPGIQYRTLLRKVNDIVPTFQLKASTDSVTPAGGSTWLTFFKCRWDGGFTWPMADQAFPVIGLTAKALGDNANQMFEIRQNEQSSVSVVPLNLS